MPVKLTNWFSFLKIKYKDKYMYIRNARTNPLIHYEKIPNISSCISVF